jgi:DNA polymerase-1
MIIGEAPNEQGEPFVGRAGRLLSEIMETVGLNRRKVFITNAVSCRPPDNRTPTKGEVRACNRWLQYQIKHVKPKYVLLLGNTALQSITGASGIKKVRGRPFERNGIIYLATYHPSFILRDDTQRPYLERDLRLFATIIKEGGIPREKELNYTVVRNRAQFDLMIEDLRGIISFDLETSCLYPWQKVNEKGQKDPARINTIGFGTKHHQWVLPIAHRESPWNEDAIDGMIREIDSIVPRCQLVMHNGKFDVLWMAVHFGVWWKNHFDTMLAHYALDENSEHGLKKLAQRYCGAPDWDIDASAKKGNSTLDQLALYQAHDLYYTRLLRFLFSDKLSEDPQVERVFARILMPCSRLFTEIEYEGIYVDHTKFDQAETALREAMAASKAELDKFLEGLPASARQTFNWGSTKDLRFLLFDHLRLPVIEKTRGGVPSCNESVLKRIDHPIGSALIKFREAKQQLSFFIEGWKPFLHKKRLEGRMHYFLHPSFKIHGTVTGRLSCEHPNLQQVPRDKRIRSLITAEPGWTLVECDLSQIELRIAAELAQEPTMIHAFTHGIDVHWLTTIREIERGAGQRDLVVNTAFTWRRKRDPEAKVPTYSVAIQDLLKMGPDEAAEINEAWKELRKKAKAINFGYLYGMWWKKFKRYAYDNYGVTISDEDAEASRTFFFSTYSRLEDWHKAQKRFARRNGYVRTLSGRKRRLPDATHIEDSPARAAAERQAINSPVQSFANELNLMAALQLRKEFSRSIVRICGTVHDAILMRVKNPYIERVTSRLLEIMKRPALLDEWGIELRVPIEAEAKIGPWGDSVSFEKWRKEHVGVSDLPPENEGRAKQQRADRARAHPEKVS